MNPAVNTIPFRLRLRAPSIPGRVLGALPLLAFMLFITAYPVSLLLVRSFQINAPGEAIVWSAAGWTKAFGDGSIAGILATTFGLAVVRVVLSSCLAIVFAWLVARTDMPLKGAFEFLLWLGFFLPALPMAMGWILLLDPHYGLINKLLMSVLHLGSAPFDIYSYAGIVWAQLAFGTSITFLLLTPAFRAMDATLEEGAKTCGSSDVSTLIRITVPLLAPAVLATAAMGFIKSIESFEI